MSALQWMSVFQGCPQGGVPLYISNKCYAIADVPFCLEMHTTYDWQDIQPKKCITVSFMYAILYTIRISSIITQKLLPPEVM